MDRRFAPLVSAERITYRVLYREVLAPLSLAIAPGEVWVVTGPNGSGKSIAAEILAGVRAPSGGRVSWPGLPSGPDRDASVVSFERQERIMERERREDMSSIMHGVLDPGHRVADLLEGQSDASDGGNAARLARRFRIDHIMERGLRFLSTGEFRKAMLASAVARDPRLLVLDEPYDGLDAAARRELSGLIEELHDDARALLLVLNRRRDFPPHATHLLELVEGRARYTGRFDDWPGRADGQPTRLADESDSAPPPPTITPLVSMREVTVAYGSDTILRDVDWEVRSSDRWMIHGPNGSGKSTLLSLVTGDNAKAYGQRIALFGRQKGSGESVWEIKRSIGIVSGDLHLRYPLRVRVDEAILSGFYDSIGLFEEPGGYQRELARDWLATLGLAGHGHARLRDLSFGQQRMVLIARAMVKQPRMLIADEPCQGLDDGHAQQVLALLDHVGHRSGTCLLYVTHNPDEALSCLTHSLELLPGPEGSRAVVSEIRPA